MSERGAPTQHQEPKPESEAGDIGGVGEEENPEPEKLTGKESPEEVAKRLSSIIDHANERLKPLLSVMKDVRSSLPPPDPTN